MELVQSAQRTTDKTKNTNLYVLLSQLSRDNNQFDSRIADGEKARALAVEIKDSVLIGKADNVLGVGYYSKTMFEKANVYWVEARKISEQVHDSLTSGIVLSYLGLLNSDPFNQEQG